MIIFTYTTKVSVMVRRSRGQLITIGRFLSDLQTFDWKSSQNELNLTHMILGPYNDALFKYFEQRFLAYALTWIAQWVKRPLLG